MTGECKHIKILRIRSVARAPKIQHCCRCHCCCLNGNLSVRIKVDCIQNYRLLVDRQLRQPVGVANVAGAAARFAHFIATTILRQFCAFTLLSASAAFPYPLPPLLLAFFLIHLLLLPTALCSCSVFIFFYFRPSAVSLFTLVAIFCGSI